MLNILKYRRYKEILFVDTENVGYFLPNKIPQNICIFLFVSQPQLLKKLKREKCIYGQSLEIIDISYLSHNKLKKNAMDFCIVAQISMMIRSLSSKQKIVIISKDKGYESVIEFFKEHQYCIERYSLSLLHYIYSQIYPERIIKKCDTHLLSKISLYSSMHEFKSYLHKKEYQIFLFDTYSEPISNAHMYIEYDIYTYRYNVYESGLLKNDFQNLNDAQHYFSQQKQELCHKYQIYHTRTLFLKAKEMKLNGYIEEALQKGQSLHECLKVHLGERAGYQLFQKFVE